MTKWAKSLIRLSSYEVETLQKRLVEIATRRASAEMRVAVLDAEREIETQRADIDAHGATLLQAYLAGWRLRRDSALAERDLAASEEAGARDALAQAFEAQKKFERVAEMTKLRELASAARAEAAALDELALQRAVR